MPSAEEVLAHYKSEWETKIRNMQPGPELDALVAEKVMGFRCVVDKGNGNVSWIAYGVYGETHTPPMAWKKWNYKVPPYSTDIAAAFEVWEHDRPEDWIFDLSYIKGKYFAEIFKPYVGVLAKVRAKSAAEAMSKCRLLAVMGE